MEPWKIILLVAAVPAGLAVGLSYMNGNSLREKIDERDRQQQNVISTQERLDRTNADIMAKEQDTVKIQQETESANTQLSQAKSSLLDMETQIETLQTRVTTAESEIASMRDLEKMAGDLAQLKQEMAQVDNQISMANEEVKNVENLLSVRNARKDELNRQIERMNSDAKNRRLGIMPNDVETQVAQAYNDWGFVVVNAGDAEGVVKGAQLDVLRQGKPVCKLLVTEVMPHESVANVIRDTLLPGQLVQVGDTVVKKGAM